MYDLFIELGLGRKEAKIYQFLLGESALTATEIANAVGESRTNTYMLLEKLVHDGLAGVDENKAVRRYIAADPSALRNKLVEKQEAIKRINKQLNQSLPKLHSLYNLGHLKPGVVYLEGLDGLEVMLDDMVRSKNEALIIPSRFSPKMPETWKVLQKGINKRVKSGLKSRIIFPESIRDTLEFERLTKQGMAIRFWGSKEYPGEIVVYGNKCVFTTYSPTVINTILTNETMATTLKEIFEDIWSQAKH